MDKTEIKAKQTKKTAKAKKNMPSSCETCVHYDVIDDDGYMGCTIDIDEDECARERLDRNYTCPYYRFYDEYKSVQKQN